MGSFSQQRANFSIFLLLVNICNRIISGFYRNKKGFLLHKVFFSFPLLLLFLITSFWSFEGESSVTALWIFYKTKKINKIKECSVSSRPHSVWVSSTCCYQCSCLLFARPPRPAWVQPRRPCALRVEKASSQWGPFPKPTHTTHTPPLDLTSGTWSWHCQASWVVSQGLQCEVTDYNLLRSSPNKLLSSRSDKQNTTMTEG